MTEPRGGEPSPGRGSRPSSFGTETLRSISLLWLAALALLILTAPFIGGEPAEMMFAVAVLGVPVALAGIAIPGWAGARLVGGALVVLLVLVESIGLTVIGLEASASTGPGVPDSTVWMLLGLGLGPLLVVSLLHALLYSRRGPDATLPARQGEQGGGVGR